RDRDLVAVCVVIVGCNATKRISYALHLPKRIVFEARRSIVWLDDSREVSNGIVFVLPLRAERIGVLYDLVKLVVAPLREISCGECHTTIVLWQWISARKQVASVIVCVTRDVATCICCAFERVVGIVDRCIRVVQRIYLARHAVERV